MRYFILLFTIFLVQKSIPQNDTLARYQAAIEYIQTHPDQIKKEWLKILSKGETKDFRKFYKDSLPIRISKKICFQDLSPYSKLVKYPANGITIPAQLLNHSSDIISTEYWKRYRFESYDAKFLDCNICFDSVSTLPINFIKVSFSNSIDNYLQASMDYWINEKPYSCNESGKLLLLLFVFDSSDKIKNVYFEWLIYR